MTSTFEMLPVRAISGRKYVTDTYIRGVLEI